jgi:signal transduction histidine kinase
VDIDVSVQENWAIVTVTDTGIGLPDPEREKIFDRFYRVETSRSIVPGSGLGLSIARAVVEAHHGRIEVDSELEKGSRFRVFLPIAEPKIPIA